MSCSKQSNLKEGDTVRVTAKPNPGYKFKGWSDSLFSPPFAQPEDPDTDLTLDYAVSQSTNNVTALFEKKEYQISLNNTDRGTVEGISNPYTYGDIVFLHAKANYGYNFSRWENVPDAYIQAHNTEPKIYFKIDKDTPDDINISVFFDKMKFRIVCNSSSEGDVTGFKSPESAGSSIVDTYDYQDNASLLATPYKGFDFVKWEGDIDSTDNPVNILMDEDKFLRAIFKVSDFTLSTNVSLQSGNDQPQTASHVGTVTGGGIFPANSKVYLMASSSSDYVFDRWELNGVQVSKNIKLQVLVDEDKTYNAIFKLKD